MSRWWAIVKVDRGEIQKIKENQVLCRRKKWAMPRFIRVNIDRTVTYWYGSRYHRLMYILGFTIWILRSVGGNARRIWGERDQGRDVSCSIKTTIDLVKSCVGN